MKSFIFPILAICFLAHSVTAKFRILKDEYGKDLEIYFKDILLMKHTEENPLLTLAIGTFGGTETQGNFYLNDEVTYYENFEPRDSLTGKLIGECHSDSQKF